MSQAAVGGAAVAPVEETRRIKSLDVVRGFALLGILAVNAAFFAAPWQAGLNPTIAPLAVTAENPWSWLIMHVFFELKCVTLFSLLFGASIYLVGGERADKERGRVLHRRLFWLMIFGLLHGLLIWFGDILFTYALTGFLVMFARSWRPRTLMTVGAVLLTLAVLMQSMFALFQPVMPTDVLEEIRQTFWAPPQEELARMIAAYQAGALSATQENIRVWVEFIGQTLFGFVIRTAGVMMIGMALYKWGFFSGAAKGWVYGLMMALGVVALALIGWDSWTFTQTGFTFEHAFGPGMALNAAIAIFVSLGYASALIVLVKAGALRLLTEALAAVGRMAFTNYLTQSLIMTTIFYGGRGLGLYGEFDRVTLWLIVAAIWALQLIWSPLWLSRFQMGPFEWVWRRLSYGRPVAIARG